MSCPGVRPEFGAYARGGAAPGGARAGRCGFRGRTPGEVRLQGAHARGGAASGGAHPGRCSRPCSTRDADLIASPTGLVLISDKRFSGHDLEQLLPERHIDLLRPARKKGKERWGAPSRASPPA